MPTNLTCEDLGLSQEQMQDRLIKTMADRLLDSDSDYLEEDEKSPYKSSLVSKLETLITDRVDEAIAKVADEHVLPRIDELILGMVFQETNRWGESKKEPLTLTEYVTQAAENYLSEPVNYDGKTKKQNDYNWQNAQTRLVYAVNSHIQYTLSSALEDATSDISKTFSEGITQTVKAQLEQMKVAFSATIKK